MILACLFPTSPRQCRRCLPISCFQTSCFQSPVSLGCGGVALRLQWFWLPKSTIWRPKNPKTPKKRIRDATLNFLSIFINLCEQFSLYFNVFGTLQLILSACVNVFVLLRIDWLWPFIALSAMLAQWILTVFASIIQVCRIALSEGLAAFSIVAFCTKWTAIPSMISVLRHRSRVLSGLGTCSG